MQSSIPVSRRSVLATLAAGAVGLAANGPRSVCDAGVANQYAGLDSAKYLGELKLLATIEDTEVFTEGPAGDALGNCYFTNVPADKILKWDGQSLSVFRTGSNKTNGLYFESDGSLLCCEGGAGRITRTSMATGEISVVADRFNGFPFAAPNDVCVDGQRRIYFSSRPGVEDPAQGNVNAVYRVDPDGTVSQILKFPEVQMPNGLVTSPDDRTLYVIEAHPDAERHRDIRAYDLHDDGSVSSERVHIDFYPGRSGDGMCIDAAGNLYVAAGLNKLRKTSETLDTKPGIHVISPEGRLVAYAATPEDTITNCAFGGTDLKTLFITCGRLFFSLRTTIPGKPAYRPAK